MACSTAVLPVLLSFVLISPWSAAGVGAASSSSCARLFIFGDSITDTGNFVASLPRNVTFLTLPFGETFFGQPSGRFCDGRLIVDFIAEALSLPAFLTPYLVGQTARDFKHGVNFAVAGATVHNQSFFKNLGLDLSIIPPYSLDVQLLDWFNRVLRLLAPTSEQERERVMSTSLFVLGEIGTNDYNHLLFQNRSLDTEVRPLLPKVIARIENAVKVLLGLGAKTVVVPGNIAMGCIPRYLAMFPPSSNGSSGDGNYYDAAGCIRWLNEFSEEHNRALKLALHRVVAGATDPTVTVIYGDYYGAMLEIIGNPTQHGFAKESALTACCGDGTPLRFCNATATLCPDPAKFISWDGLHLTEAAYRFVARGLLHGPYAQPSILSKCMSY